MTFVERRVPKDYDGILSAAPAINWSRFIPSEIWPQVVMNEADNFVPQCKFAAFNAAAMDACDDIDGVVDGVIGDPRLCDLDPSSLVGTETASGTITQLDADVMRKIWEGPRDRDGRFLCYGLEPSAATNGLAHTREEGGAVVGVPFGIAVTHIGVWLEQDLAWRSAGQRPTAGGRPCAVAHPATGHLRYDRASDV